MGKISEMTVDELAQVITPEFLEESAQIIKKDLAVMPFQVLQDQTAKYITFLPGIRNQITFGELNGDAQLRPFKHDVREDADYSITGRTLEVYPGNCAKDFDPMPLFHSIWGESIAMGEAISKGMIAKKLVSLFAAKIGMHINDVVDTNDDHFAPGMGKVDFAALKPMAETVRHVVFEPNGGVSEDDLVKGLELLKRLWA